MSETSRVHGSLSATFVEGNCLAWLPMSARPPMSQSDKMKAVTALSIWLLILRIPTEAAPVEADVCVYGGTSGGVVAAVQVARMGKRVVLVEPGRHLGGLTSGGLSAVDIGDPRSVGGIAREYFSRLVANYGKKLNWGERFKGNGGPVSGSGAGDQFVIRIPFNQIYAFGPTLGRVNNLSVVHSP